MYAQRGGFVSDTILLNSNGERARFYRIPSRWLGAVRLRLSKEFAKEFGWELAPIRLFAAASIFFSLGITLLVYLGLWLYFSFKE